MRARSARRTAALSTALALAACGTGGEAQPSWVAGHPSTTLLTFDTTAPGVCAITVQYPDDAPAAIEYLGGVYVQLVQAAHSTPGPTAHVVDHSGNWQVAQDGGRTLVLFTPTSTYDYRLETTC